MNIGVFKESKSVVPSKALLAKEQHLQTLNSQFKSTANKMPEQIAVVINETRIEYGRLLEAILRLANGLKSLGVQKGDRVAIMLPNVPHFIISYYGILELGAVVVPINIMFKKEDIAYQLSDSGATILIAWIGFKSHVLPAVQSSPTIKETLFLGEKIPRGTKSLTQLIAASQPYQEQIELGENDLAVINYTSGVADVPLGAELTHGALAANATVCKEMYRITSQENVLAVLPLFHPLGQTLLMHASFLAGAMIVLLPRFSVEDIAKAILEHKVTFMAGVPGIYQNLNEANVDWTGSVLRYCVSYGGKLSQDIIHSFEEKLNAILLQAYGLTEAGPLVSANRIHRDRKDQAVGLPLMGTEIHIRNHQGNLLRPNNSGEIWVHSPSIMRGYYNHPEETNKRLQDGWLFTGDMGYLDEEHYLYIEERKEDIIFKDGFEIFPHEIEEILKQHSAISEVAVVGIPDATHGTEIKVYIVLKKNESITQDELFQLCRSDLPLYKCPKNFEFCSELPKSSTGRTLKRVLRNNAIAPLEEHNTEEEKHE